jgi:hypothetical protein
VRVKSKIMPIDLVPSNVEDVRGAIRLLENSANELRKAARFLPDRMETKVESVSIRGVE